MKARAIAPPPPYRANKRITRCRGSLASENNSDRTKIRGSNEEASKYLNLEPNGSVTSWSAFDNNALNEGVEVAFNGYNTISSQENIQMPWSSISIDQRELLDIDPVPAPQLEAAGRLETFPRSASIYAPPISSGCRKKESENRSSERILERKTGLDNSSSRFRSNSGTRVRDSTPLPSRRRSASSSKYQANEKRRRTVDSGNSITEISDSKPLTSIQRRSSISMSGHIEVRTSIHPESARSDSNEKNSRKKVTDVALTSFNLTLPTPVYTRHLLPTSVYHNQATGIWITTINMSQKEEITRSNAAKYLKAFSFPTENEARESAYANAPPRMLPFTENSICQICSKSFSFLTRPCHCRNCGICICNSCVVPWSKQCIPDTYHIKNEKTVRVCKSCNTLSTMFKKALLDAKFDDAITIYNTGNINLRCPFPIRHGEEMMLPIHCAAMGGSLDLFIWLAETHFCPIKRIRTGNKNKSYRADELITTSKGRSVINIALAIQHVDMLRYLVNEKGANFSGVKDLNVVLNALTAVLKADNREIIGVDQSFEDDVHSDESIHVDNRITIPNQSVLRSPLQRSLRLPKHNFRQPVNSKIGNGLPSFSISDPGDDYSDDEDISPQNTFEDSDDDQSVATTVHDACIICYENSIDCVITPCGHQICCLRCSKSLSNCPVCNVDCKCIRIFRP